MLNNLTFLGNAFTRFCGDLVRIPFVPFKSSAPLKVKRAMFSASTGGLSLDF